LTVSYWNVIRRKARTARQLSGPDWGIFFQAWFLLLAVDLGLRLLPFPWLQSFARRVRQHEVADEAGTVQRVQRLVDIAARNHLYPMGCLRRSLVLQRLLGRRGIATELRIGVRKEEAELQAHAWLEYAGQPVGEPGMVSMRYAALNASETGG
jgi:hypothetical protein